MKNVLHPNLIKGLGRKAEMYDLSNFRLDQWELFVELLIEFGFFFDLGFKAVNYQAIAADYVADYFRDSSKHTLAQLDDAGFLDCLNYLSSIAGKIYTEKGGGVERVQGSIQEVIQKTKLGQPSRLLDKWRRTSAFFSETGNKKSIQQIVNYALFSGENNRPVIVVDLSKNPDGISESVWDDKLKPLLIDAFLSTIIRESARAYKEQESLNTLVVLDEAHRFAPQERDNNERKQRVKRNLVDAVRTTRKYGLGWMFLSQTLSSLDNEIVQQLRISFFGFGLSMGTEFRKLQELVGGKGEYLKLYQQFRDPHSSFDTASREYSFMTIGPVSPLSFAGTPLFFNAFSYIEDFIKSNGLITQGKML